MTETLEPWVQPARPSADVRMRLVCFPHAGGGASFFRDWPRALAPYGIEVWPVQLPGRDRRYNEPLPTDLTALTATLADAVGGRLAELPYALYGHSVGARFACAFAARLAERGLPAPRHVCVGASRPPTHPDPDTPIHAMTDEALLAKLETYGGIPRELHTYPELLDRAVATARADLRVSEIAPWPELPWLDCPVTAVGGRSDATVPAALLPHWQSVTTASFDTIVLEGGHFPEFRGMGRLMEVIRRAAHTTGEGVRQERF
ncbi:thioesterase II family protein [Streptomyces sp. NPDC058665]|uniref:thioesterase II family protein n=1 Tax=Streptomyces sp. NPDC058665 TaxID=3346586 RepID=UPI00364BE672